ncbi:Ankyrin repeat-containing protein ITN1, partial [Linum perenne]
FLFSDTDYTRNLRLYRALDSGDWEASKRLLNLHTTAATASLSPDGDTPLHVAVLAGHVEIVEGLIAGILPAEALLIKNRSGATALNYAAIGGVMRITECLVRRAPELVRVPNLNGHIPVVVAALYGHDEMVRYLYHATPKDELVSPSGDRINGAMLLTTCIVDGLYDIALDLLKCYPQLAVAHDSDKDTALRVLSQTPSAFRSGASLAFWQWWIYSCTYITLSKNRCIPIYVVSNRDELLIIGIGNIELLRRLCRHLSTLPEPEFEQMGIQKALFNAVSHGIVEFIVELIRHYPDIVWREDDNQRGIFLSATLHRQEKIFSLIYKMGAKKNAMATSWDLDDNNILHQAAFLAPPSRLESVTGAALQMQRELQWYKEVESIVQPKHREMKNKTLETPKMLFTREHRALVEEGEKWMKETATSCTVVAALIATIMFSALFTVPGGFDQNTGLPVYLHRNTFLVFVVCDAVSFFASSSSMLMFLGILTSRYREEDFLSKLPMKLIIGLSTLFLSMATMMITFGVSLAIFLRERFRWVTFPIMVLASVPVTLFALLQFPLLVDIFSSTYGPGIFDKPKKKRRFIWALAQ